MKVRFYFSIESLHANSLYIASPKVGYCVSLRGTGEMVAEAIPDGSYFYTYTDGQKLPNARLKACVSHMTIQTFEKARLTEGVYKGDCWEAEAKEHGHEQTRVDISMTGSDVEKLKGVYQKIVTGQLLPSYVVKDRMLTSEQVADIVCGDGSREHWLNVVQGAQDAMTKTFKHINAIQAQMAALVAKNAELEALIASQGK